MNSTLTTIAPAIILGIIYLGVKVFPPTLGNAFISGGPSWWHRDQKTWDKAYALLASNYFIYTIILAVCCLAFLFIDWMYASYLGYLIMLIFLGLTHYQVRKYMEEKVR